MNDYRLVISYSPDELRTLVCQLLDRGWQSEGPVQLTMSPDHHIQYVQTMVKS